VERLDEILGDTLADWVRLLPETEGKSAAIPLVALLSHPL
jgi:hypothetical protein